MTSRNHVEEKKVAHENGSTRSEMTERFDLLPYEGIRRAARRAYLGRTKHGARNWEGGEMKFASDTLNHLQKHAARLSEGFEDDDDLGAVIFNGMMLAEFEKRGISIKKIREWQRQQGVEG